MPFCSLENPVAGVVIATAVCLSIFFSTTTAWPQEQRVEVGPDQTTTIVGSFDSLEALLIDLCAKGNAKLRSYDAVDRAVTVHHENQPLREVVERLLAQENYLLGVRGNGSQAGSIQLAWVHVTGSKGIAAVPGEIAVSPNPGVTGVERASPTDGQRAQAAIADRLLADDAQVAKFLLAEAHELAQSLRQYPDIELLLRKLRAEQQHPALIEKIDAVLGELAKPEEGAPE